MIATTAECPARPAQPRDKRGRFKTTLASYWWGIRIRWLVAGMVVTANGFIWTGKYLHYKAEKQEEETVAQQQQQQQQNNQWVTSSSGGMTYFYASQAGGTTTVTTEPPKAYFIQDGKGGVKQVSKEEFDDFGAIMDMLERQEKEQQSHEGMKL